MTLEQVATILMLAAAAPAMFGEAVSAADGVPFRLVPRAPTAPDARRAPAPPPPRAALALVNASTLILNNLYVSPCGAGNWGSNQLGGVPVPPGREFTITDIEPGCYDLKVSDPPWFECVIGGARLRGYQGWIITTWTTTRATLDDCSTTSQIAPAGRRPWGANSFVPAGEAAYR